MILMRGLIAGALFGAEIYVPYLLIADYDFSPTWAGLGLTAAALLWAAAAYVQGRFGDRIGNARITLIGTALLFTALVVAAATAWAHLAPGVLIAGWALAGAGMGLMYPRLTVLTLAYSTPQNQGFNSSALSISDAIGASVAIAVMGLTFVALTGTDAGFPVVFAIAAALALLALVPGLRLGHAHEAVARAADPSPQFSALPESPVAHERDSAPIDAPFGHEVAAQRLDGAGLAREPRVQRCALEGRAALGRAGHLPQDVGVDVDLFDRGACARRHEAGSGLLDRGHEVRVTAAAAARALTRYSKPGCRGRYAASSRVGEFDDDGSGRLAGELLEDHRDRRGGGLVAREQEVLGARRRNEVDAVADAGVRGGRGEDQHFVADRRPARSMRTPVPARRGRPCRCRLRARRRARGASCTCGTAGAGRGPSHATARTSRLPVGIASSPTVSVGKTTLTRWS